MVRGVCPPKCADRINGDKKKLLLYILVHSLCE